jgi:hypothetical protein
MVVPHRGVPAGQSVHTDGVVVVLTYFNRSLDLNDPDGRAQFMLANLKDHAETVTIAFYVAYNSSDFYRDNVVFEETIPAGGVVWKEIQRERYKEATFGRFFMIVGAAANLKDKFHSGEFHNSTWRNSAEAYVVREECPTTPDERKPI